MFNIGTYNFDYLANPSEKFKQRSGIIDKPGEVTLPARRYGTG
jgi:hypothetical protein